MYLLPLHYLHLLHLLNKFSIFNWSPSLLSHIPPFEEKKIIILTWQKIYFCFVFSQIIQKEAKLWRQAEISRLHLQRFFVCDSVFSVICIRALFFHSKYRKNTHLITKI
mmetsp:Transcript_20576/g.46676  ORF Transcript_20576/g.46676 Transcript_20576/m.46676 type:complete len:109 (-) Transcript_20576:474-800(-)